VRAPEVEASRAEWRAYFAAGSRYDIPYDLSEMITQDSVTGQLALRALLTARNPDMAVGYGYDAYQITEERKYVANAFGVDPQHPTLGISGWGLHFPTLPNLPWSAVAAVIVSNQLSAMSQASNGYILDTPPVGNDSTVVRPDFVYNTGLCVITKDGRATRALALPAAEGFVTYLETPAGAVLGQVMPPLDPFLGPEQMVEYLFLLHILAEVNDIKIYQVEKYLDIASLAEKIRLAN
jgi:hypothetical protein